MRSDELVGTTVVKLICFFFFQAEDGIRDVAVTGVQTCALPICGLLAAVATALMASQLVLGLVVAVIAFIMIGIGVGAAGTSLLVLLAKRTAPERRSEERRVGKECRSRWGAGGE